MFGRTLNETLGRFHFWLTLVPFYGVFLTQHFIGLAGMPRRYYMFQTYQYLEPVRHLNVVVTYFAFALGAAQLIFLANFVMSLARGRKAVENPWRATTLEWTTVSPPPHGNWTGELPSVERWAYEYSPETTDADFVPQTVSAAQVPATF
jgi:cytochrome c oxidase subunit 1